MSATDSLKQAFQDYFDYLSAQGGVVDVMTAETPQETNLLLFSIDIKDLFEWVKKNTAIKAKFMATPEMDVSKALDLYSLTDDEYLFFELFAKQAALRPLEVMIPYSKKIFQAYLYDEGPVINNLEVGETYLEGKYYRFSGKIYSCLQETTQTPDENPDVWKEEPWWIDTKGKIIYFIHHDKNFNIPSLKLINEEIFLSLGYFVLHLWWDHAGLINDALKNLANYQERIANVKRKTFHRIDPIRRNTSLI